MHSWDLTPKEAIAWQKQLARRVEISDRLPTPISTLGGVDVGFEDSGKTARAAVTLLDTESLNLIDSAIVREPTRMPYIPGLLSFRELPAILRALRELSSLADVILCDGHGYAHPRRFGIACHLGLWLDIPTIGVGKSRLCGQYEEPGEAKGNASALMDKGEIIGHVVRTRTGVRPVFVSPGHRVSHATAVSMVLRATTRYRLPETTRTADRLTRG